MAVVVAVVVALDQATKSWAVANLADGRTVHVVWTLELDLAFNSGLSFSQGEGLTGPITVVGIALVAGLVWWSRGVTNPVMAGGLSSLLGGACGNLADRLFRDHGGAVVDFIDFQWWPVFNVADIAVFVGAGLLILSSLRDPAPTAP
ncbi:MAG TPA: signal peptidase II [Acidimicrobiales bacterium]|nr:signal peptidase II [Acidimicrobiales bacterium]